MDKTTKTELIKYLRDFVTDDRWQKINEVLDQRTRFLTVVLEDIYQPHNASAVLRNCECFGIQDVHVIENENKFDPNKGVTIGAEQWISLHQYKGSAQNNTGHCYKQLKEKGYRIIATTPHKDDQSIDDVSLDQKTALAFGAELNGLSDYALEHADGYARIPMVGFSESFNISVCAAICLYEMSPKLRKSNQPWKLTEAEKLDLKLQWLEQSIRASDQLKTKFLEEHE
jgi:tRNA (guanosine-2'-O-)-methyltransferase